MKQIIVYIGVAAVLSLTACNDSFLDRSISGDSIPHLHLKHLPGVTGVKVHGNRFV